MFSYLGQRLFYYDLQFEVNQAVLEIIFKLFYRFLIQGTDASDRIEVKV